MEATVERCRLGTPRPPIGAPGKPWPRVGDLAAKIYSVQNRCFLPRKEPKGEARSAISGRVFVSAKLLIETDDEASVGVATPQLADRRVTVAPSSCEARGIHDFPEAVVLKSPERILRVHTLPSRPEHLDQVAKRSFRVVERDEPVLV